MKALWQLKLAGAINRMQGKIKAGMLFIMTLGVILFFITSIRFIYNSFVVYEMQSWPQAKGLVISKSIHNTGTHKRARFAPVITYKYTVDGEDYISTRIACGRYDFAEKSDVEIFFEEYVEENRVTVFYDSASPSSSTIVNTYHKGIFHDLIGLCIGVFSIFISCYIWLRQGKIRGRECSVENL